MTPLPEIEAELKRIGSAIEKTAEEKANELGRKIHWNLLRLESDTNRKFVRNFINVISKK